MYKYISHVSGGPCSTQHIVTMVSHEELWDTVSTKHLQKRKDNLDNVLQQCADAVSCSCVHGSKGGYWWHGTAGSYHFPSLLFSLYGADLPVAPLK